MFQQSIRQMLVLFWLLLFSCPASSSSASSAAATAAAAAARTNPRSTGRTTTPPTRRFLKRPRHLFFRKHTIDSSISSSVPSSSSSPSLEIVQDGLLAQHESSLSTTLSSSTPAAPRGVMTTTSTSSSSRLGLWPPWPFSMLQRQSSSSSLNQPSSTSTSSSSSSISSSSSQQPQHMHRHGNNNSHHHHHRHHHSGAATAWLFIRRSMYATYKNVQGIGTQLYVHLPPAAAPFLLLAAMPYRTAATATEAAATATAQRKVVIPLLSNPFCRSTSFCLVSLAILSWAHDLRRQRSLTLLPLADQYIDINRAILPPFLPEQVPVDFLEEPTSVSSPWNRTTKVSAVKKNQENNKDNNENQDGFGDDNDNEADDDDNDDDSSAAPFSDILLPRRLRRHWFQFLQTQPPHAYFDFAKWRCLRENKRRERLNARRLEIYDELLALQRLKKKALAEQRPYFHRKWRAKLGLSSSSSSSDNKQQYDGTQIPSRNLPLGYALVTGASRGIGRALAVELARWEIPLILVARDMDRLIALAYDLEAAYGVKCCVLQADLSKPRAAECIYKTTQDAGLPVEILVNNAGISLTGNAVDMPIEQVNRMVQINAASTATLMHLYGREMKKRRRGRILMVSSICGAVAGIPTVALYSATKAFENSLSIGLAKEMEAFGVGVTCLMPGAVRDTEFRTNSKTETALCWKLPFYAKTPSLVAEVGIRSMLRGDTEVTPGWQNRLFIKVLKPILPQRLHNLVAEIAWNPLHLPFHRSSGMYNSESKRKSEEESRVQSSVDQEETPEPAQPFESLRPPHLNYRLPPRLLQLDEDQLSDPIEEEEEEDANSADLMDRLYEEQMRSYQSHRNEIPGESQPDAMQQSEAVELGQ